jgi:hypothetical protein
LRSGLARGDQHASDLVPGPTIAWERKTKRNRPRKILVRQCTPEAGFSLLLRQAFIRLSLPS